MEEWKKKKAFVPCWPQPQVENLKTMNQKTHRSATHVRTHSQARGPLDSGLLNSILPLSQSNSKVDRQNGQKQSISLSGQGECYIQCIKKEVPILSFLFYKATLHPYETQCLVKLPAPTSSDSNTWTATKTQSVTPPWVPDLAPASVTISFSDFPTKMDGMCPDSCQ